MRGPSPDAERLVALEDCVVREEAGQAEIGAGGSEGGGKGEGGGEGTLHGGEHAPDQEYPATFVLP